MERVNGRSPDAPGLRMFGMLPHLNLLPKNGGLRCPSFAVENEARQTEVAGKVGTNGFRPLGG